MADNKKIANILELIKYFVENPKIEVDIKNKYLIDKLGNCSSKSLGRYLKELESVYPNFITLERVGKKNIYRLAKISNVLKEVIKKNELEIGYWLKLAKESDPDFLKELSESEKIKLENTLKFNEDIYFYKTHPFEEKIDKKLLDKISIAIKNREYRDITFLNRFNEIETIKDSKILKIVFVDDNWYIAVVNIKNEFLFIRVKFIQEINYSKKSESYQPSSIEKYLKFLREFQNSMTLFDIEPKVAKIRASKRVSKYFQKDSKKFLSSQTFISQNEDETVEFSLTYTQPLEILPFIKKWLPDLQVLEPIELKRVLKEDLERAFESLRDV